MATGGRVTHHLTAFAPDARNTILFTGHQAGGTRGVPPALFSSGGRQGAPATQRPWHFLNFFPLPQ